MSENPFEPQNESSSFEQPQSEQYAFNYSMFNNPQMMPQAQTFTWFEAWKKAMLNPNVENYRLLLADPRATIDRAFIWLAIVYGTSFAISYISSSVFVALFSGATSTTNVDLFGELSFQSEETGAFIISSILLTICLIPFTIVFALVGVSFFSGILHVVARIFGGNATFDKTLYALALIWAPITLISSLSSPFVFASLAFPYLFIISVIATSIASLILSLYSIYLETIAIKAAHNIGWGESFITVISPVLLVFGCCLICFLFTFVPLLFTSS